MRVQLFVQMIGEKIAVLDLGTNSFHILIAKVEKSCIEPLVSRKEFVMMAANGKKHIDEEVEQRAYKILDGYKNLLEEYQVTTCRIFATEGLRRAVNSADFIKGLQENYGFNVEIIDGNREAALIFKGVKRAYKIGKKKVLAMDIGGGSCEFIIGNKKKIFWAHSFPIGASVMRNRFHHTEPITQKEYDALIKHYTETLKPLWEALKEHEPVELVGASGSFTALLNMQNGKHMLYPALDERSGLINLSGFKTMHLNLLRSNLEERQKISGLEPYRAEIMVAATTLISLIISKLQPSRSIVVSNYAMKEGMLLEMAEELSLAI